jgi:hypothetical protein
MRAELLIAFSDDSNSFVCGVEFGRMLARMENGDATVENQGFPIHPENADVLRQACATYGYTPTFGIEKDGWQDFKAVKQRSVN